MTQPGIEHLVDLQALQRFVDEHVPGERAPITVEKHTAGFSNETFYVSRAGQRWVMRRPPAGPLLPTAHDVLREYRFISALHGKARVPAPVAVCDDSSVIGAPFYLMERVEGHVPRFEVAPAYTTIEGRRKLTEELIDGLVELHAVDWQAAGIPGRAEGYLERQVKRWSGQWELTRPRTRELPGLDAITQWLIDNRPESGPSTVVHGDYKLDNVMFDAKEPRLLAIFDWEMATVGDPLADLGWLLNHWQAPPEVPGYEDRQSAITRITDEGGFPSSDEIAEMYERKSGRSMKDFLFYRVLAAYKGIVILEGLYMHYIEGAAANPAAEEFEWRVPMSIASTQRLIAEGARG